MTIAEMNALKAEYGNDMSISKAIHLHDEDEWNEYVIAYKGIAVGSELVSADFVRKYIEDHKRWFA